MTQRQMLAGLTATAHERIALNSTPARLNSTTRAAGGSVLRLSVEAADCRFREFGVVTTTTGILLNATGTYYIEGYNGTGSLRFVGDGGAASIINVARYKHTGDQ